MHDAASNVLGREAREEAVLQKKKVVLIHVRLIMVSDQRPAFGFFFKKKSVLIHDAAGNGLGREAREKAINCQHL